MTNAEILEECARAIATSWDKRFERGHVDEIYFTQARAVIARLAELPMSEEAKQSAGLAISELYLREGGWCGKFAAEEQAVITFSAALRALGGEK